MDTVDSFAFEITQSANKIKKTDILPQFTNYTNGYYESPMFDKKFIESQLTAYLEESDIEISDRVE